MKLDTGIGAGVSAFGQSISVDFQSSEKANWAANIMVATGAHPEEREVQRRLILARFKPSSAVPISALRIFGNNSRQYTPQPVSST